MNKKVSLCVLIILALMMLSGCNLKSFDDKPESVDSLTTTQTDASQALPAGLYVAVDGLPEIDEIPSDYLEKHKNSFPNIASVYYLAEGASTEVPTDDARLFRLLNFIGESFDEGSFGMQFGFEEPDEIALWYTDPSPMLEITFYGAENLPNNTAFRNCTKLLIRNGTVLKVYNKSLFEDGLEKACCFIHIFRS